MSAQDIDVKELIGKPVKIREEVDEETIIVTKGEIVDFNADRDKVNIKTVDGKILNRVRAWRVYVYMNSSQN